MSNRIISKEGRRRTTIHLVIFPIAADLLSNQFARSGEVFAVRTLESQCTDRTIISKRHSLEVFKNFLVIWA